MCGVFPKLHAREDHDNTRSKRYVSGKLSPTNDSITIFHLHFKCKLQLQIHKTRLRSHTNVNNKAEFH